MQGFPPCKASPGRLSYWEETEVKRHIDALVDLGKMRPNNSKYAYRVTLPVKKDGSRRFCGDYRPLNAQTRRDMFSMPLVEDVIDQLGKSTWFTALDLQSGFWQIRMAPEDMKKTALITKTRLYDWIVMPFGLKNATSTFTRIMSEVFKDLGSRFLKVFIDDLNVHSESWGEHLQHLDAVLCKLREVNLKLNPSKCCFAVKTITFLGHVVSKEGIRLDPGKIEAVLHFPTPKNVTSVRSFLGLTGYYRKYVRGYSSLAGPLFELTRRDVAFVWDMGYEQAYQALKAALVDAPVLTRPDFKHTFWLDVDWSPKGVGAILSQKEGKFERVIVYASKSLTEAQRRFHPMEGECYTLIWGVMHFRQYLHMKHFILRTDHKPLEWLATVSDAHGRRGRWVGMLQDFSFKIVHRPGLRHTNVNALNRNPIGSVADDDDFGAEIQDITDTQADVPREEGELFCVKAGKETEWMWVGNHQLYMLDAATVEDLSEEFIPGEEAVSTGDEPVQHEGARMVLKRRRPQYFDKRQQLDLALAAQEMSEFGDHELGFTESDDEGDHGVKSNCVDIWEDTDCMTLLKEGVLPDAIGFEESKRIRKRASNYC